MHFISPCILCVTSIIESIHHCDFLFQEGRKTAPETLPSRLKAAYSYTGPRLPRWSLVPHLCCAAHLQTSHTPFQHPTAAPSVNREVLRCCALLYSVRETGEAFSLCTYSLVLGCYWIFKKVVIALVILTCIDGLKYCMTTISKKKNGCGNIAYNKF